MAHDRTNFRGLTRRFLWVLVVLVLVGSPGLLGWGEGRRPPLSERVSDIPALCAALSVGMGEGGLEVTDRAMAALQSWPWPGKVRELRQVLRYAREAAGGPVAELE